MNIDRAHNRTHSSWHLWKARLATTDWRGGACVTVAVVLLGTAGFALMSMSLVRHHAYHKARVVSYGTRLGSKRPGVAMWVALPDGRRTQISSARYNPGLTEGSEICVQELTDQWRTRARYFQLAPRSRCLSPATVPAPSPAPSPVPVH